MDNTEIGDRMKEYEATGEASLLPLVPVLARLDGKAFHSFTKGMQRPFDLRFRNTMTEVTRLLLLETGAKIGYTQSDEITLVFYSPSYSSEIFMGGRSSKMISLLAAMTTMFFDQVLQQTMNEFWSEKKRPLFDCRVWNVPTKTEACNALIWREQDATRNSIQMAGRAYFSHRELKNVSCAEIQEKLFQHGINWNDYPIAFKRGTYVQRRKVLRRFTIDEIEKLPPLHEARHNPELMVERGEVQVAELPIFTQIINREEVVFDGAEPLRG